MKAALESYLKELDAIREAGTWREERIITTPQRDVIDTTKKAHVVNMCANNYLGLADNPELIAAAKASYDRWGFGLSSVRFICGTQEIHKELERRIADFVGTDDAILYSSCFDANGGLFETITGPANPMSSRTRSPHPVAWPVPFCSRWYAYTTPRSPSRKPRRRTGANAS